MRILGNLVWFVFGGALTGILWDITVIGISISKQCFKIAGLCFCPFGKTIVYKGGVAAFFST